MTARWCSARSAKARRSPPRCRDLILEARRVAATVIHGLHGRRRAGPGENFWQYRRFVSGEPAARVDWRRSARDDHLYVREQEWEAAHTVWIWPDRSPSMAFASPLVRDTKLYRALVVAMALAEVLVEGGERVGIPGLMRPTGSRNVIERMAQAILHDRSERASLPPDFSPSPLAEIVLLSDLWSDISDVRRTITQLSGSGARGHVVQIVDPAEETFPYWGRIEFVEPEGGGRITAGRAQTWRTDYAARVRATAPRSAPRPTASAGASPSTAPTVRRANFCSLCTPASAARGNATSLRSRRPSERRRHDWRFASRICRTAGSDRTDHAAGAVVASAADPAPPSPHRLSADPAPSRNSAQGRNAGTNALVADAAAAPSCRARHHRRGGSAVESAADGDDRRAHLSPS